MEVDMNNGLNDVRDPSILYTYQSGVGRIVPKRGFPLGVGGNPAFAFGYEPNGKPEVYTQLIRSVDLTNHINYAYDRRFLFDFTQTISGATTYRDWETLE